MTAAVTIVGLLVAAVVYCVTMKARQDAMKEDILEIKHRLEKADL